MNPDSRQRILVAGVGGASLGTEIIKSLAHAARYRIFGCDISPLAYGHFVPEVERTFLVRAEQYTSDILEICRAHGIQAILAGGERPLTILRTIEPELRAHGVLLAGNRPEIIDVCSDKGLLFDELRRKSIAVPNFARIVSKGDLDRLDSVKGPCVVKPATGSGGSAFTLLTSSKDEAKLQCLRILDSGNPVIVQEYLAESEGEFTVGVLSIPAFDFVGSVALRRELHAKLSVSSKSDLGVISTGYSQGLIADFNSIRCQAEDIARALRSDGPLNLQGRIRHGIFYPFEINPRFSATTFLRTLAGFNEIDVYLQSHLLGTRPIPPSLREGYYLRSLAETFVPLQSIQK
ncbi:MAG: ATP-grasp domain-containing protein [Verrucomicrobiota bacterium]